MKGDLVVLRGTRSLPSSGQMLIMMGTLREEERHWVAVLGMPVTLSAIGKKLKPKGRGNTANDVKHRVPLTNLVYYILVC